jgi:flagellar motility protein MotE (MotC chaperone)
MIRLVREFRLIPVVLLATVSLFALKVSGLVFDGGYTLAERMQGRDKSELTITTRESVPDYPKITVAEQQPVPDSLATRLPANKSWAQEMFNYADAAKLDPGRSGDITGSVGGGSESKEAPKAEIPTLKATDKAPDAPKVQVAGNSYPLEAMRTTPPGERAVLERLQERRKELDSRARDLDMRESLLKAAEKRVEDKINELKATEGRVSAAMGQRESAEAQRFKGIVSMYENMKAKDAARIFDRLDIKILVEVSTAMNPRKMSEILSQMTPESAERLTVELANRASASARPAGGTDALPKIEGKPAS